MRARPSAEPWSVAIAVTLTPKAARDVVRGGSQTLRAPRGDDQMHAFRGERDGGGAAMPALAPLTMALRPLMPNSMLACATLGGSNERTGAQ